MIQKVNIVKVSPSRYRSTQSFKLPLVNKYVEVTKERNSQGKLTYLSSVIANVVNGKKYIESGARTVMRGSGLKKEEIAEFNKNARELTNSFSDNLREFEDGNSFIRTGDIEKERYLKNLNNFFTY